MDLQNDTTILLVVVAVVLVAMFMMKNNRRSAPETFMIVEGLDNVKAANVVKPKAGACTYNPRAQQAAIAEQVTDNNFIPLPTEAEYPWAKNTGNYGESDILDDGAQGSLGLNFNMCSKACCSSQYPPPFSLTPSDMVLMSDKEFVPTSYSCNNGWQDSGCLCMTKAQASHLNSRGGNGFSNL